MDGLFPEPPKDMKKVSDQELKDLLAEHEHAAELIDAENEVFLKDLSADEIIEQYRTGALQIMALREELKAREVAAETYAGEKAKIAAQIKGETTDDADTEAKDDGADADKADDDADKTGDDADVEVKAEVEADADASADAGDKADADTEAKEAVLVADADADADAEETPAEKPRLRRAPPLPSKERAVVSEPDKALSFVASGLIPAMTPGSKLETRADLAEALRKTARGVGAPTHMAGGREEKYLVASLDFGEQFPDDRVLHPSDWEGNAEKIRKIGSPYFGLEGVKALVASGGFCAPLEPIYSMPQLATNARPVRDALPNFRATRGGINVPTPTTIGDALGAITVISAAEDALGGTFATKSCLDMDCPTYSEYAVTVISHCREFGNLNAMAWPEKIAHELELTMAEHARVAEGYLLDQIKALSVNVTSGADTLGALIYLVDAITKSAFGIRSRLRLPDEARFVALLPRVLLDMLLLDTVQSRFDRYRSMDDIETYLGATGIDVSWYLDSPTSGVSQIADAAQTIGALDAFPDAIQWAVFPAGTFLHLDMAELNLGIVRDSTLNSTNDFQNFGETFENVARIGPAQAAYWETTELCPVGTFPPDGTARGCEEPD